MTHGNKPCVVRLEDVGEILRGEEKRVIVNNSFNNGDNLEVLKRIGLDVEVDYFNIVYKKMVREARNSRRVILTSDRYFAYKYNDRSDCKVVLVEK